MGKFNQQIYHFILGFFDSISLYWIRKILLVTHPTTKKINPASLELLGTFKNTFIQVFVFLLGLPYIFRYFNQFAIAFVLSTFFLILTYGYLFFYNTEVMASTKKVALWSAKFPNTNFCQFDNRQKAQLFYSLSNRIKSFIFLLLYYTPILLTCLILINYLPFIGTTLLVISQSFFNAAFYFLKKWPYDRFNVGFIQGNMAYMLGYGFFVSFVCNVVLTGDFSRGAYFLISQWMIINCLLFSPAQKEFSSFSELWKCVTSSQARSKLPNAYNIHRNKIRENKAYREKIIKDIVILKPALKITQYLNSVLAKSIGQTLNLISTNISEAPNNQNQSLTKESEVGSSPIKGAKNLEIVSQTYQPQQ